MANYNRIILAGNLTRDPQLSYLPSQTPVVELGLAVNRRWTGQDGQRREETCFIDCRAYGRQADTIAKYFTKGRNILIEGRLQFDMWEAQDGTKRSKHRVIVDRFEFLGDRGGASAGGGGYAQGAPAQTPPQNYQGAPAQAPPQNYQPAPQPRQAAPPQTAPPQAPPPAEAPPPSSYDQDDMAQGEDIPF